jgi:hypothetical protein
VSVRIVIDRLVLEGLDLAPVERVKLVAALETAVARQIAGQDLAAGFGSGLAVPRLAAPHMILPGRVGGAELGTRIAGALCDAMVEAGQ